MILIDDIKCTTKCPKTIPINAPPSVRRRFPRTVNVMTSGAPPPPQDERAQFQLK